MELAMRKRGPKYVSRTPLSSLWDDAGPVPAIWKRDLSADDIRELLRSGTVRFVIANVGTPIHWIPECDCFKKWKEEILPHLANRDDDIHLIDYEDEYCYLASEWVPEDGSPIVVLTCYH
jgi:hypothetical protein